MSTVRNRASKHTARIAARRNSNETSCATKALCPTMRLMMLMMMLMTTTTTMTMTMMMMMVMIMMMVLQLPAV